MARLEELTPGQAQFVLERIVADKKIKPREIDKYIKEMDSEIETLEERLSMLRGSLASGLGSSSTRRKRSAPNASPTGGGTRKGSTRKRGSRPATSPEAQKSRQLQGQYISLIKRFSGKERDKFKALAKEKGREEAVNQMKKAVEK